MANYIEGSLDGTGKKFGIVVSRFNNFISERLLEGSLDALRRHGVKDEDVDVVRVPGSFEIPVFAKKLVDCGKYNAVICLGAVIRGATPHFEYISAEVTKGIAAVGLSAGVPVIYGVITTDTIEQAVERAGTKSGNKGFDAAMAALETASLVDRIGP
jgi:6,7-dimethyl-8-ribityllumazine synthase